MPTTLELAGIKKPEQVDFNSLLSLASGKVNKSNYPTVYGAYFGKQRMYRTEKYKLIIYPTINKVRLYDMINDPFEMKDLAENKAEYKVVLTQLYKEYSLLQKEMNDPLNLETAFQKFMNG